MVSLKPLVPTTFVPLVFTSLILVACGGGQTTPADEARGVAPESFVSCEAFHRANERREREEEVLLDAKQLLADRPCSIATLDVQNIQNAGFLQSWAVLREAGERACRAGVHGLVTTRDSEGRLRVTSVDGRSVGNDGATFVFGEASVEVQVRHDEVGLTRGMIDGFSGIPAHRLYFNDARSAVISAEPGTELMIRGPRMEPVFVGHTEDERAAKLLRAVSGDEFEIFARFSGDAVSGPSDDYRFTVSTLPEDVASTMDVWRPDVRIREGFLLEGSLREASTFGSQCYGNVPSEPTMELFVQERGFATIGAESSEDAIIAVISPSGVAYCNDDWNGLNPLVEVELTEGVWQIYVGAWSSGMQFPFELAIEPR